MLALGLVQVNKQSNDPRLSKNSFLGSLCLPRVAAILEFLCFAASRSFRKET